MTLRERAVSIAIIVFVAIATIPLFFRPAKAKMDWYVLGCRSNLKQLCIETEIYAGDNNDVLLSSNNWMDALEPMTKNPAILRCWAVGTAKSGMDEYGYAFNRALSVRHRASIESPSLVPIIYDSLNLKRNASDLVTSLPQTARHGKVNNIVYADGHVNSIPASNQLLDRRSKD